VEQLALFENCTVNVGVTQTPNARIEVIQPLPLNDLMFLVDLVNEGGHNSPKASNLQKLGRGAFGTVLGYKDYAIKYFRDGADCYEDKGYNHNNIPQGEIRDAYILKELQSIPSIPRIYAVINNEAIIMEKVDGENVDDYRSRVRSSKNKSEDNYVSLDFNKVFVEALKDILHIGYEPYDLHGYNVMVCRKTGLPKIVDVGLFKKIVNADMKSQFKDKNSIDPSSVYPACDAMSWIHSPMEEYIERKTNPAKWEEIDRKEMIRQAEREAYQEKRERERNQRQEPRIRLWNPFQLESVKIGTVPPVQRLGGGVAINLKAKRDIMQKAHKEVGKRKKENVVAYHNKPLKAIRKERERNEGLLKAVKVANPFEQRLAINTYF
jgi:hypothetical protein